MTINVKYSDGSVESFKDVVYWDINKADYIIIQSAASVSLLDMNTVERMDMLP